MSTPLQLIAFDLDGTLTQHKSPLSDETRVMLDALAARYRLLMVGAGAYTRIHRQMGYYPIDIIGHYGMQCAAYDSQSQALKLYEETIVPVDRKTVELRVSMLREQFGYTDFIGESVEYHASGMLTFPLLGTSAMIEYKLGFDPDRMKRASMYSSVCDTFNDYTVYLGGSSSFDIIPRPFGKYYAIMRYCKRYQIPLNAVVYIGDDYGPGGNDEDVYRSDIRFICVDDYQTVQNRVAPLLT